MPEVELFTARFSPFAQRVRLSLLEKRIPFLATEIDLAAKPEWFLVISPRGEVPVIRHEDRFVSDSTVILEYLEDVYPEPALRPRDPGRRALLRYWIEYADESFKPVLTQAMKTTGGERADALAKLRAELTYLEQEWPTRRGPFWLGSDISLLDLVFYPYFERLPAIFYGQALDGAGLLPTRLRRWWNAMRERASVQATSNPPERHARAIVDYLGVQPERRRVGNIEYLQA
jgi:glutathione S-transferase